MHLHSYLRSAADVISAYDGLVPFAAWLKTWFRQYKKFGSRDRKAIADLCFCFFRLGDAFAHETIDKQLLIGQFLCHDESAFLRELKQEWSGASSLPLKEKLALLQNKTSGAFFPFLDEASEAIEKEAFNLSHLVQPDLFLRIRPGKEGVAPEKLQKAFLPFSTEGDCVRLSNTTKADEVLALDEEVVIQDKSSQRVLNLLRDHWQKQSFAAWDCCAASGGKSLLLHDAYPQAQLTVSDVRESILHNLRNRFKRAGIFRYQSFAADVSSAGFRLQKKFDVVICDAPCSGSGTWGRTPEGLRFFQKEKMAHYASLQKAILINASECLNKDGMLLYITCSVFKKENEDVAEHIAQQTGLGLIEQRYFKGYNDKADTLFAALFRS